MAAQTPNEILRDVMSGYAQADAETRALARALANCGESGHVFSELLFGEWWLSGRISRLPGLDGPKLIEQLLDAVNRGHRNAYAYLGRIYRYGVGVPVDLDKAIDYFGDAGSEGAMEMAAIHEQGLAGPRDEEKLAGYYRFAGTPGSFRLGLLQLKKAASLPDDAAREEIERAIKSFAHAEKESVHKAAGNCRRLSETFRLLLTRIEAPLPNLCADAALCYADGQVQQSRAIIGELMAILEARAGTGALSWRLLGNVCETLNLPERAAPYYVRALAGGDAYAGALLAMLQDDSPSLQAALEKWRAAGRDGANVSLVGGLKVELFGRFESCGLIFRFDHLYLLFARNKSDDENTSEAKYFRQEKDRLRRTVRSAFQADAARPGCAEADSDYLLRLLGQLVSQVHYWIRCGKCGKVYENPEVHYRIGSRALGAEGFQMLSLEFDSSGEPQLLCPEGHTILTGSYRIVD